MRQKIRVTEQGPTNYISDSTPLYRDHIGQYAVVNIRGPVARARKELRRKFSPLLHTSLRAELRVHHGS